jgi:hypothetical protein
LGIGQEIGVGLMGDNPRLDPIHRDGFPLAARKALHRRRCTSAILARPAVVFGPVDSPIFHFLPDPPDRSALAQMRMGHGLVQRENRSDEIAQLASDLWPPCPLPHFQRQNAVKPARCQRRMVSG